MCPSQRPSKAIVERWNAESTLEEEIPKVYPHCCTNTNENGTKDDAWFSAHYGNRRRSVLLTNASRRLSGDQEGTLIVP
jgi:hypothetical protein